MIPMTYSDTYEAIIEHLKTFPDLPLDNVQVGNMPVDGEGAFVIPNADVWARMTINYGQTFISGLADNPVTRRVGVLSFQLFGERGYGEYPLLDLAEKLTQHFQFHRVSFLEFLTGSTANISASGGLLNSSNDVSSGEWHQVNVNFTFRVYTNGAKNTPTPPPPPPPPPPVEPPVLLSEVVSTNGLSVLLTFDKAIAVNNLILDLSVNGATRTYTYTVNGAVLTITPASVIYQSETVSIAYTSGIEDVEPFAINTLNNSSVVKPVSDAALAVFGVNDKGVYYDFDDLSTLYIDASMSTNAVVGQTVGVWKDKSGKGWNTQAVVAATQAKVAFDVIAGSNYLMFDGVDDQVSVTIPNGLSLSRGVTMVVAAEYKTSLSATLNIGLANPNDRGVMLKGSYSSLGGGLYSESTHQLPSVGAENTVIRSISAAQQNKDCLILRCGENGVRLDANDGFSNSTTIPFELSNVAIFKLGKLNRNYYKILIINRVLTDAECDAIRTQFNAAMGV